MTSRSRTSTASLSGYYIQILRQAAAPSFADESLARIIGNGAGVFGKLH